MTSWLIIGGTRNLGPDLVSAALASGFSLTVLNRGLTGRVPAGVDHLTADRSDPAALAAALAGRSFDVVVDTTLYNGADARAVAELLEGRVGRFVFWSTGQVYLVGERKTGERRAESERPETGERRAESERPESGERRAESGARESDYDVPLMAEPEAGTYDHGQWKYGVEKRAAEDALREAHERRGFDYLSLRMPMINSYRDHYGRLAGYANLILAGEPIPVPDNQGLLRHVFGDDVIQATLLAAARDVHGERCLNISQDETLTLEEMLSIVAATLGRPLHLTQASGPLTAPGPWSSTWMSVIDNSLSKRVLGIHYTPPAVYLPLLLAPFTGPR